MAKSCPCCLMMSSVSSFLSRRSFSEEKKASSFIIFFLFSICLSISPVFVNDNKKDLPLHVQDVFSHT